MKRRILFRLVPTVIVTAALVWFIAAVGQQHFAILDAQGTIARQQRDLLVFATILSLVVIIPVFALTFHIVRKYRVREDGSQRAKRSAYAPDMEGSNRLEALWWGIPTFIILILSVVTWQTSHSLDPYKPLASTTKDPMTIQVVAMQWKWLFIYPDQKIATVNYFKMPIDTPVKFVITSDAPMNSFWIPQLGGQVYAMSGMTSQLHLQADRAGSYRGSSANISGEGFADMHFTAQAVRDSDFRTWIAAQRTGSQSLTNGIYQELSRPAVKVPNQDYSYVSDGLFETIVMKDMSPKEDGSHSSGDTTTDTMPPTMQTMEGMTHAQ